MSQISKIDGYQEFTTQLLDITNPVQSTSYTLSDTIYHYKALLVLLSNSANASDVKPYYIPSVIARTYQRFDCSWNATDSTSWYIVCTIAVTGDSAITITKLQKAGFTDSRLIIYGLR